MLLPGFLLLAHTLAVADGFNITLIKNITLLSADQNQVHRETGFVLLEGEKITWVGKNKPALADKLAAQSRRPGSATAKLTDRANT